MAEKGRPRRPVAARVLASFAVVVVAFAAASGFCVFAQRQAVEEADLVEDLEVVADRRLGELEGVVEVADAGFAVGVGGDQGQQAQADRVGERLEQGGDPFCLLGAQRLLGQR